MSQASELLTIIYTTITPLFLIVGIVIVASRHIPLNPRVFSRAIIYIFSPALLLTNLINTEMQVAEIGNIILTTVASGFVMAGIATLITRLFGFERKLASTIIITPSS